MEEREVVKIKSDNPAHPHGYYWGFKDQMKPEDKIYDEQMQEAKAEAKKKVRK